MFGFSILTFPSLMSTSSFVMFSFISWTICCILLLIKSLKERILDSTKECCSRYFLTSKFFCCAIIQPPCNINKSCLLLFSLFLIHRLLGFLQERKGQQILFLAI